MDDRWLKELGGGNYWKELLDRIRDIRSSEKESKTRAKPIMIIKVKTAKNKKTKK